MWGADMGTGCKVRISGGNGREGFGWEIRASHVGLDGEGRKRNLGLDRGMKRGPAGDVGGAWECCGDVVGDVDGTSVEHRVQRKGGIGDMTGM